jgi:hypothetical protein
MRGRLPVALLCVLGGMLRAQQPAGSSVDAVLRQMQAHLEEYRATVPDVFCSEHVVSSVVARRAYSQTVTDSNFRLRKTRFDDGVISFEETRSVLAVDGKKPLDPGAELSGPAVLSGVFSDGLRIVSHEVEGCYVYTVLPPRDGHPKDKIIVKFKEAARETRPLGCPPYEGTWGQATVDPVSMRALRLEKTTPDAQKMRNQSLMWRWTVDYAPVELSGKTFWMPKAIHSTSQTESGDYLWSFDGSYRNYHLFRAESKIVPIGTEP